MKWKLIRLLSVLIIIHIVQVNLIAQNHITKTGKVELCSENFLFDIVGVNSKVASSLNTDTGVITTSLLTRSFVFEQILFEESFNDDYLESHKFPNSIFRGKIIEYKDFDFSKNGVFDIMFEGKLNIHGKTNYIKEKGILTINEGIISLQSEFNISVEAFEIKLDGVYDYALRDEVHIKMQFNYKPYFKN